MFVDQRGKQSITPLARGASSKFRRGPALSLDGAAPFLLINGN
jgi:hypothetical protein